MPGESCACNRDCNYCLDKCKLCNACDISKCIKGLIPTSLYGNRYYSQQCRNRQDYYTHRGQILQNYVDRLEYDEKKEYQMRVENSWIPAKNINGNPIMYNKLTKEIKY